MVQFYWNNTERLFLVAPGQDGDAFSGEFGLCAFGLATSHPGLLTIATEMVRQKDGDNGTWDAVDHALQDSFYRLMKSAVEAKGKQYNALIERTWK